MVACETQILESLAILVVSLGIAAGQITPDYNFIHTPMSWVKARESCRRHYVDMAVLSTEEQYSSMLNTTASSKDSYWLGLQRQDIFSSWKWVNGEELGYKHWYIRDIEGRCASLEAMLGNDHKLLARLCNEKHMLVCQGPASPQSVAVNSASADHVSLSWNVSGLMQMTPHSYYLEICTNTCNTIVSPYINSPVSITVNISQLTSVTEYSVTVTAFVVRPDRLTGKDVILQGDPRTIEVQIASPLVKKKIIPIFLKMLKLISLAPPLWLLYYIVKKEKVASLGCDSLEIDDNVSAELVSTKEPKVAMEYPATL